MVFWTVQPRLCVHWNNALSEFLIPGLNNVAVAEFDIIARYFAQADLGFTTQNIALGIGDDCALLSLPVNSEMAISTDMLLEGVHFPATADPFLLAQRSLLVNLSDLAAMGATPIGFTLAISLPAIDEQWLQEFCKGLTKVAQAHACPLIGGDTTRGPLSVCITVHGWVPKGEALKRSGAQAGDLICVTGFLGDAAAALAVIQGKSNTLTEVDQASLLEAYYTPKSCVAAGQALRGLASSAIDISDGLASDLRHILKASNKGAKVRLDTLPMSSAFCSATPTADRVILALGGGDDYELCFTVAEKNFAEAESRLRQLGVPVSRIGEINTGADLQWLASDGNVVELDVQGYTHFG